MSIKPRLLEGELLIYNGMVFVVKGYQHPRDHVIAYPRYDLFTGVKIPIYLYTKYQNIVYWDCIKQYVNMIPLKGSVKYSKKTINNHYEWIVSYLSSILNIDINNIELTGSAPFTDKWHDIDLVIYGCTSEIADKVADLIERGVLNRTREHVLVNEYFEKHVNNLSLREYLYLKKDTLLHLDIMGHHVNLKLYRYDKGFNTCIHPVSRVDLFTGKLHVFNGLTPSLLPSIYMASTSGVGELFIETYRELYAELKPGVYYAKNCRLEHRDDGLFLVPDNCVFKPVQTP
ncbi:MAG: hypothetical protein QXQ17_03830 [Desulfurococcaceae archaeon]